MTDSTTSITNFPAQVLDLIFEFASVKRRPKDLSLVCKSWCEIARRHIFRSLKIYALNQEDEDSSFTPEKMAELVEFLNRDGGKVGKHVRKLDWNNGLFHDDEAIEWTGEDVVALLHSVPDLEDLKMNICQEGYCGKYWEGDFDTLEKASLPSLENLELNFFSNEAYEGDYRDIIKQILAATPNLVSLTLGAEESSGSADSVLPPINLPLLEELDISDLMGSSFHKLDIVTLDTLKRVERLIVDNEYGGQAGGGLLEIVGPQITMLNVGGYLGGLAKYPISQALALCPNIESLVVSPKYRGFVDNLPSGLPSIPPHLTSISIENPQSFESKRYKNPDDLVKFFTHKSESDGGTFRPSAIKTIETELKISAKLKKELAENGVEVSD